MSSSGEKGLIKEALAENAAKRANLIRESRLEEIQATDADTGIARGRRQRSLGTALRTGGEFLPSDFIVPKNSRRPADLGVALRARSFRVAGGGNPDELTYEYTFIRNDEEVPESFREAEAAAARNPIRSAIERAGFSPTAFRAAARGGASNTHRPAAQGLVDAIRGFLKPAPGPGRGVPV